MLARLVLVTLVGLAGCREDQPPKPKPKPKPKPAATTSARSPDAAEPGGAEKVPAELQSRARAANERDGRRRAVWGELLELRACLSQADNELRLFEEHYRASLVGGVPGKPVREPWQLSRGELGDCAAALARVEGGSTVVAAHYRAAMQDLVPSLLELRDYYSEADYKDDGYARVKALHETLMKGFEALGEARRDLRRRAAELRGELAKLREEPPRLDVDLVLALWELEEQMASGAPEPERRRALAALEAARGRIRSRVADLDVSRDARDLDQLLNQVSSVLGVYKRRLRRSDDVTDAEVLTRAGHDVARIEYDLGRRMTR